MNMNLKADLEETRAERDQAWDARDALKARVRELEADRERLHGLLDERWKLYDATLTRLATATALLRDMPEQHVSMAWWKRRDDFLAGQSAAPAKQAIPNGTVTAHEIAKDIAQSKLPDFAAALAQARAGQPAAPDDYTSAALQANTEYVRNSQLSELLHTQPAAPDSTRRDECGCGHAGCPRCDQPAAPDYRTVYVSSAGMGTVTELARRGLKP